jgi:hypothetical protein
VVEEDERPDHATPGGWQQPSHGEAAEITGTGVDDQQDTVGVPLDGHGLPLGRGYDSIEEAPAMANELDLKAEMKRGVDLLRTLRDEIKVKLHLAGMDAKDQWAKLEPELFKVERAAEQATESSKKLMDEALNRLKSLRDSLR